MKSAIERGGVSSSKCWRDCYKTVVFCCAVLGGYRGGFGMEKNLN